MPRIGLSHWCTALKFIYFEIKESYSGCLQTSLTLMFLTKYLTDKSSQGICNQKYGESIKKHVCLDIFLTLNMCINQ